MGFAWCGIKEYVIFDCIKEKTQKYHKGKKFPKTNCQISNKTQRYNNFRYLFYF
jgi:hypothetical protein